MIVAKMIVGIAGVVVGAIAALVAAAYLGWISLVC
jgi:hypothetical protein